MFTGFLPLKKNDNELALEQHAGLSMALFQYQPTHEAYALQTRLFGPKTCFCKTFST